MIENNYEKNLDDEIEKRIEIMESSDYIFPQKFNKRDYIVSAVVAILCIAIIIYGAYL